MANCIRCGRQLPGLTFGKKICQWCVQHEASQRGELAEDARQPVMRTPWVRRAQPTISLTQIIFGMNLIVFLAMAPDTLTFEGFPGGAAVAWAANISPYTISGEWWRLITYMFLHANLLHIGFNMWCLWDLGAMCESLYGRWTYGAIYLLAGIGGGIGSLLWNGGGVTIGASGAIFGLAGALFAAFKMGEFSVPREALSGTLRSLMVFIGFNLFFGFSMPGIDNAAHIGGLITGLALGALIAKLAPQHDHDGRRAIIFATGTMVFCMIAVGLAHYHGVPFRLGRV